jgi:hypothetical protein
LTAWQSFQMISLAQWAYAIGLAGLFWACGPSLVAWVLLADFIALLAIAGAMDFALIEEGGARWSMLVVWVATAAVMAMLPGAGRVIAAICAVAIMAFVALLFLGVQIGTTSAILNLASFIIIGVAGFGIGGDSGAGRRFHPVPLPLEVSGGNLGVGEGGVAHGARMLSQGGGGLN